MNKFLFFILFLCMPWQGINAKPNVKQMLGVITQVPITMEKFTKKMIAAQGKLAKLRILVKKRSPIEEITNQYDEAAKALIILHEEFLHARSLTCFKILADVNKLCGSEMMLGIMAAPYVGQVPVGLCSKLSTIDIQVTLFFIAIEQYIQKSHTTCAYLFDKAHRNQEAANKK